MAGAVREHIALDAIDLMMAGVNGSFFS